MPLTIFSTAPAIPPRVDTPQATSTRKARQRPDVRYTSPMDEKLERNLKDVVETLAFMRHHMVTKDDLEELRAAIATKDDIASLRSELREINERLDGHEDSVGSLRGYAKELDELRSRIGAIEKHLGVHRVVAA